VTTKKAKKRGESRHPPRPPAVASRPAAPREVPDIQVGYTSAGRETLAAIAEELGPAGLAGVRPAADDCPEIEIGQTAAGRETLAAINEELLDVVQDHVRRTVDYEDRPPAPGRGIARPSPSPEPPPPGSAPPPRSRMRTVGFSDPPPGSKTAPYRTAQRPAPRPPGRATLDAIDQELSGWAESGEPPRAPAAVERDLEVFEMATFVVKGELSHLASSEARRQFVQARLLHRLPVAGMDDVDRIDVTPWTVRGTVVVRVWCRVPPA
jgi:hypothetical protein